MPEQYGSSLAHPYNANKWTFEASEEVKAKLPPKLPPAPKEIKPPVTNSKKA